jgi:alkaline phosphatase D
MNDLAVDSPQATRQQSGVGAWLATGGRPVLFPDGELGRWASLGGVTDRAVRVWLRDPGGDPQRATLEIDGVERAAGTLTPCPEHDWTAAADLILDRPAPDARFTVQVAGSRRHGRFAPRPDRPAALTFAFGSCHQPFGPARDGVLTVTPRTGIYRQMAGLLAARDAHFLALVGDQIYSDGVEPIDVRDEVRLFEPPPSDEQLREAYRWIYRGYFNASDFRHLLEAQPTIMAWDDHDITEGWGALIDWSDLDWRVFRAAEATYREYQHVRHVGASVDDRATYHRSFWWGDIGFFILDLRGVREYRYSRLIGDRQWRDLYQFLEEATARGTQTLFIVAGIPVVHHAPALVRLAERIKHRYGTDLRDRWSAAPIEHERTRFLELLLDWQSARAGRQVTLLSGDVHAGGAFRITRRSGPGVLNQWTSSPLTTRAALPEHLANIVGSAFVNWGDERYHSTRAALVRANNFGLVQVTPADDGGHRIELCLYAFRPGRGIRIAARVTSLPTE